MCVTSMGEGERGRRVSTSAGKISCWREEVCSVCVCVCVSNLINNFGRKDASLCWRYHFHHN